MMQDAMENWQKKIFSMMNPNEQSLATSNIIRASDNVNAVYSSCVDRAIKALFLINSGGTITILAYIPHATGFSEHLLLSLSLIFFLIGLILVCVVVAYNFHWAQKKLLEFNNDTKEFLLKKIPFESIRMFQIIQEPDEYSGLVTKLGWASGFCGGIGIFSGLLGYFSS